MSQFQSQAKATKGKAASTGDAMMGPASNGLRVGEPARTGGLSWPALGRTSNVSERGVTGRRDAHPISEAAGTRPVPSVSGSIHRKQQRDTTGVTAGETAPNSSSGDGLGIHQPGSNTRGFAIERQPASGRARYRAKCPAVARSHGSAA